MIRRARAEEAAWVAGTIAAAFSVYIPRMGRKPAPMTTDEAALIAAGEVHLLEEDGERRGLIVLRDAGDHLFIDILAVPPALQHQGAGRVLLAFAETEARRLGHDTLRLYTNDKMTENQRFYPRLGYRRLGARNEDGFARIYFEKPLD
jgi:GNAT superfamily N-acetyltransferase